MREWDLEGAETQTATQKGLRLVKRNICPVLGRGRQDGYIQRLYFGSRFLKSCQWTHFLLSKMFNVIFHNFHLGVLFPIAITVCRNYIKVKYRQRAGFLSAARQNSAAM